MAHTQARPLELMVIVDHTPSEVKGRRALNAQLSFYLDSSPLVQWTVLDSSFDGLPWQKHADKLDINGSFLWRSVSHDSVDPYLEFLQPLNFDALKVVLIASELMETVVKLTDKLKSGCTNFCHTHTATVKVTRE